MKCPNCRCIIPSTLEVCSYCGYEIVAGCKNTYKVDDYSNNGRYSTSYYDNYYATDTYYGYGGYYPQEDYSYDQQYDYSYNNNGYYREKRSFAQRILDKINGDKLLLLLFVGMTYLEILLLCILFVFI